VKARVTQNNGTHAHTFSKVRRAQNKRDVDCKRREECDKEEVFIYDYAKCCSCVELNVCACGALCSRNFIFTREREMIETGNDCMCIEAWEKREMRWVSQTDLQNIHDLIALS